MSRIPWIIPLDYMEFNCKKNSVTWIYIQCVGRRECDNQSLHALSLLAAHPGSFLVITSRGKGRCWQEPEGQGNDLHHEMPWSLDEVCKTFC